MAEFERTKIQRNQTESNRKGVQMRNYRMEFEMKSEQILCIQSLFLTSAILEFFSLFYIGYRSADVSCLICQSDFSIDFSKAFYLNFKHIFSYAS